MGEYTIEDAYNLLMSPAPYTQSSASAMIRNFGTAAQLMASLQRQQAANVSSAGDAGAAAAEQYEMHATWFDQVASNSADAANAIDTIVQAGNQHQATAQSVYSSYQQAVANDSGPNPSGMDDMNVIHQSVNGSNTLSQAVNEWGSSYSGLKMPAAPRPPSSGGSGGSGGSAAPSGGTSSGGTSGGGTFSGGSGPTGPTGAAGTGDPGLIAVPVGSTPVTDRGPGVPGSVEVGPSGGEFAGWYHDPRTGYYIDPQTGREFDPVSNRWIDPVTGLPFGQVTQYATGLQGLGGASTTGGLLSDTAASGMAGLSGADGISGLTGAGGFAGLVGAGNPTAVAGFYGGMVPPSLGSASAASSSLWQQASRSLAVKQDVAANLLAREQAARAGRAYLPPTQAGLGAGATAGGRSRPGYLTAEEEEAGLFSSRGGIAGRRLSASGIAEEGAGPSSARGTAAAEEEAGLASSSGRRAYLPPTQAGVGKDGNKKRSGDRPDWLVDDDVFGIEPAPSGVLGEDDPV